MSRARLMVCLLSIAIPALMHVSVKSAAAAENVVSTSECGGLETKRCECYERYECEDDGDCHCHAFEDCRAHCPIPPEQREGGLGSNALHGE